MPDQQQHQPAVAVVPGQPPKDAANDADAMRELLRQYPILGPGERRYNAFGGVEVMAAEGVPIRA